SDSCSTGPMSVMSQLEFLFISYFFFFYSYGAHRHLHSFPTRRSSDLNCRALCGWWICAWAKRCPADIAEFSSRRNRRPSESSLRSEEHTSELQSHLNLVCRLLLEKKNKPGMTQLDRQSKIANITHHGN